MLNIRRFVQGKDEELWVSVWNEAFQEFEDFRNYTAEEMRIREKSPEFDATGMFLAEFDGEVVGCVNAYVDRQRKEKKGFIRTLGVVPKFRRRGIGRKLAEIAMTSLKERGMQTIEAYAVEKQPAASRLWARLQFRLVRTFSLMKRDLVGIPMGIGENHEVSMRQLDQTSEDDIELLNNLENETFSEHYNFRPSTVDETRYFLTQEPTFRDQEWLLAALRKVPIGYIGIGIDKKYNEERGTRIGWILDIGVLKPQRRRGIGTRLMIEGLEVLKAKGMEEAMLGVDDQNPTEAIKLYEKVGFKVRRKDYAYLKTVE